MISYELPMGLTVAGVLLVTNTMSLHDIVMHRRITTLGSSRAAYLPISFSAGHRFHPVHDPSFAETNRIPFDLRRRKTNWWPVPHRVQQHEVRSFFMPSTPTYHGHIHGHAAVPGRLASAVSCLDGVEFCSRAAIPGGGSCYALPRPEPGAPRDRYSLPVFAMAFFALAPCS
jgi:hypothetical protein